MTELFNNREIATGIWMGVAIFFCAINKDVREAILLAVKAFCNPRVVGIFSVMGLYIALCVFLLSYINLWNISLLKETVYWVLFTGLFLFMNRITGDDSSNFFRKTLFELLKVMVLVQFLINFFPMSLPIELILFPLVSFLVIMSEYSGYKSEYAAGKKLFDWLLTIFGLFVLGYVARNVYLHRAELMTRDVLLSLLLPVWLTLLILPFLYLAKLVSDYENMFIRISFFVKDDALIPHIKWRIIKLCHFNLKRLNQFSRRELSRLRMLETRKSADQLFDELQPGLPRIQRIIYRKLRVVRKMHINWQVWSSRLLRYLDVVAAICFLGSLAYVTAFWLDTLALQPFSMVLLIMSLTVLVATLLSTRLFRLVFRAKSMRFSFIYPSILLVSIVLLLMVSGLLVIYGADFLSVCLSLLIISCAFMIRELWGFIEVWLLKCPLAESSQYLGLPKELKWIQSEEPISELQSDQLSYAALVRRLADMVIKGDCRSFGLTGLHGSGKTSVMEMVEDELRKQGDNHWFVFVGGWGRGSRNISASVLESIVARMHKEGVEALSLLSWPSDYMHALLGDSSFMARAMGCCLRSQQDSTSILQRLDPVLNAVNKRVVVVIEDVDRNTSCDGMHTLCHLLDEFGKTQNVIFFFLKSIETRTSIDFHRLCEHTEMMPSIDPNQLRSILMEAIQACKKSSSDKILLHEDRLCIDRLQVTWHEGGDKYDENVLWPALCVLAHTPRSLKHALRRIWGCWKQLGGEVDLLELVLWSLLREGCPKAYEYLRSNLRELRQLKAVSGSDEKKLRPVQRVREQIKGLDLPPHQERAILVALTLLDFKVSIYAEDAYYLSLGRQSGYMIQNMPAAPQSISFSEPTDYFKRLEAGALDLDEVPDQDVIQTIKQYDRDRTGELPSMLADEQFWAKKIEQFQGLLTTSALNNLIENHIKALGEHYKAKAQHQSPGFMELRNIWKERSDAHDELQGRLKFMLFVALDYSMGLAHSVYDWYVDTCDVDVKRTLRFDWIKELRVRITGDERYLSTAMNSDYPWTLYNTIRYRDKYLVYNTAEEWKWITPYLLDAMNTYPEETIPNIAHLLIEDCRAARAGVGAWFEVRADYYRGMCASPKERASIAKALLRYADAHSDNDATAEMIKYVEADLQYQCIDMENPQIHIRMSPDGE